MAEGRPLALDMITWALLGFVGQHTALSTSPEQN